MTDKPQVRVDEDQLKDAGEKLKDWRWRMDNLYYITDKSGRTIKFKMNEAQKCVFLNMHYRNCVLKSRQLGMTTFMLIFMLDQALTRKNTRCAIICHNKDDAARLFDEKVKFAYDRLPDNLKSQISAVNDRSGELKFSNGSSLSCGVSFRGGSLRYMHISEFGKICAKYPDKAREIVTGAFEAVGRDCVITLESTAEGRSGYFFEYCQDSEKAALAGKAPTNLDWKFFFFPWDLDPTYTIDIGDPVPQRILDYFEGLSAKTGKSYTEGQMRWYAIKEKTLGSDMKREYPSCSSEAFEQSLEGAFYERQFRDLYKNKQITTVPHDPSLAVHTCWDLGINDATSLFFFQQVGRGQWNIIDFYENSGESLDHYAKVLADKREKFGYTYGTHIGPHDLAVRSWTDGKTRLETALAKGIRFEIAPRLPRADGIEAVRNILPMCWFDESKCEVGLNHLQGYRKEWNDRLGVWKDTPLHDECSNAADAFRYFATATHYIQERYSNVVSIKAQPVISAAAWS